MIKLIMGSLMFPLIASDGCLFFFKYIFLVEDYVTATFSSFPPILNWFHVAEQMYVCMLQAKWANRVTITGTSFYQPRGKLPVKGSKQNPHKLMGDIFKDL